MFVLRFFCQTVSVDSVCIAKHIGTKAISQGDDKPCRKGTSQIVLEEYFTSYASCIAGTVMMQAIQIDHPFMVFKCVIVLWCIVHHGSP